MKLYLTGEPCTQQRHCYFIEGESISFIVDCGYQRCYEGDELPHLSNEQIRMKTSPARSPFFCPTVLPVRLC